MPILILVRHGRTQANSSGVLAGWTPGVRLDDVGREQVDRLAQRLAGVRLAEIVSSPLERTVETAESIAAGQSSSPQVAIDDRFGECRYGDWTNQSLADLAKTPLWKSVQERPSSVTFPGGESLAQMQARAIAGVHDWNSRVKDRAAYAIVSHGDVIKAIIADAMGVHLDNFQRIVVDPASVSVVQYGQRSSQVLHVNDSGSDLSSLGRVRRRKRVEGVVGGGSGDR